MSNPILFAAAGAALFLAAGSATAQATRQIEPVVPTGPAVVGPTGAVVPVIRVEDLEGVETVTLDTPRGPVVVISWPTSGAGLRDDTNIDFSQLDANDDGYLTNEELAASKTPGAAVGKLSKRFKELDTSSDGRLSFNEVVGWVHR